MGTSPGSPLPRKAQAGLKLLRAEGGAEGAQGSYGPGEYEQVTCALPHLLLHAFVRGLETDIEENCCQFQEMFPPLANPCHSILGQPWQGKFHAGLFLGGRGKGRPQSQENV